MPTYVSGPPGLLISLLMHLRNAGRRDDTPEPQASNAAPQPQPQTTAPSPDALSEGSGVRFDFSNDQAQAPTAASGVHASPATAPAAPVAPATTAAVITASAGGGVAMSSPRGTSGNPAASATPAAELAGPVPATRIGQPAGPDDEAQARAWAIQSLARENTLSLVDRIARMAERPESPEKAEAAAATGSPRFNQTAAEPTTLVVA